VAGILVGVDGSDIALGALRWALEEARLRGVPVHVVTTWEVPALVDVTGMVAPPPADVGDLEATARLVQDEALAAVDADATGVEIVRHTVLGNAGHVLAESSHDADLLVVGSRGLGGISGALLGSVSRHLVRHAACPLVILRPEVAARFVPAGDGSS